MIDKSIFKEIRNLRIEYEDIKKRIRDEENKVVVDSVRGSSSQFPYIEHNFTIKGIEDTIKHKKYRRMLKNKEKEIDKKITSFEYMLNSVKDSELRIILRYKYLDGLKNYQIAEAMNKDIKDNKREYTADSIRMQINRFFEKK